jgi:hypothetical protein
MRWRDWCDEEVYYDCDEYIPRKELILDLAKNAIMPFVKKRGYDFSCNEHRLAECIARYMYYGRIMHDVINDDYRNEDYNHYYFILDDTTWDTFWSRRLLWADLDDTKVREGIRFCIWTLLDLYTSPITKDVDEILGVRTEEDETLTTDTRDPYLIDSSNGYFN